MGDWVVNILGYLWCFGEDFDTVRGVCDLLSRVRIVRGSIQRIGMAKGGKGRTIPLRPERRAARSRQSNAS